jgi:bacillithiol system protein YtxJ
VDVVVGVFVLALLGAVAARVGWPSAARSGSGPATFIPVPDMAALDEWFARSAAHAVVLFLHDPGCPVSAAAYRQMRQVEGEIPLIDVRFARQISCSVEARTGVRHESPQVIVLRRGHAAWSASHYAITAAAVEQALRSTE